MRLPFSSALLFLFVFCAGCAGHGTAHVAPNESLPHITWEIRSGGDSGDAEFVCGSDKQAARCVLPASTPENQTMVTVHVYLHGVGQTTTYAGKVDAPFVQGFEKLGEVNTEVPAGSKPMGVTIAGARVTSKPGAYRLAVRLTAAQGKSEGLKIAEEVPVVVK